MRTVQGVSLALLAGLLLAAGCSNNKGKLEGTKWVSLAAKVKEQDIPAGAFKLEFRDDGKVVYESSNATYTGTYTLGAGENVTLHLDKELAKARTHVEKITVKDDKLTMTDSDGTGVEFARVK